MAQSFKFGSSCLLRQVWGEWRRYQLPLHRAVGMKGNRMSANHRPGAGLSIGAPCHRAEAQGQTEGRDDVAVGSGVSGGSGAGMGEQGQLTRSGQPVCLVRGAYLAFSVWS